MTGQTPGEVQAAVVEVLREHHVVYENDGGDYGGRSWLECGCDADNMLNPTEYATEDEHRAHVAAVLAAAGLLATTPTEGRDDSGVGWHHGGWSDGAMTCSCGRNFSTVQAWDDHVRAALDAPTAPTDHEERP